MGLHLREELFVNPLGGPAQRELAQRGQIRRREEVFKRAFRLFGNVDLAFLEPFDQVVGRKVNQFDRVGPIEYRVGNGFAHANVGYLCNDVVQAFNVLDIDRRIDVDPVVPQFLDVQITLWMPAAFGVGVREFVDEHDLWPPRQNGVEVHFAE
jgi:hypothetical protein